LEELNKRVRYARDVSSAEILGKIMEKGDFALSQDYEALAMEVLHHESLL
jgi:hypothetical protein